MSLSVITYQASGNINPARFVAQMPGSDFQVIQSTASTRPVGISHNGTQEAPGTDADAGFAATNGRLLRVYNTGEEGYLELGGVVSAGDFLVSDSVGRGVTASLTSTSNQTLGAFALQSGFIGHKVRVQVRQLPARQA